MKYITLVGDSHAEGLASGFCEYARIYKKDIKTGFVVYKGVCAYNVNYSNINIHDFSSDIILAHFGENDIRHQLPKHKNAEETAKKYIQKTLDFFKDNRVIFLGPTPQALDELTHEFNSSQNNFYTLEQRLEQQRIFTKTLAEYKGIEFISMQDIFGIEVATKDYLWDGCHFNRDCGINVAKYVVNYIDKAVD
jgi:lysophospholipase L1-like esterase